MDQNTIEWMINGPVWIKYAVERQILGLKPDVAPVLQDPVIIEIVKRLKDKNRGIPAIHSGLMNADNYENPYWDLFFLADLGLNASELDLNNEIEAFLNTQSKRGTFITELGMEPTYFCKSAIILASIVRMGYHDDPRIKKYIQLFLTSQRLDGGWYCNQNHDIGNIYQDEPSCPQDNLNILLILGQYEKYRHDPVFNRAIDLLLRHWEIRDTGIRIVYFGTGKRYQALKYPATRYGIVRVIDAVSLFPYSFKRPGFQSMIDFIRNKGTNGKYLVESPSPYTNFEPKDSPNCLLSFIINRVEHRIDIQ